MLLSVTSGASLLELLGDGGLVGLPVSLFYPKGYTEPPQLAIPVSPERWLERVQGHAPGHCGGSQSSKGTCRVLLLAKSKSSSTGTKMGASSEAIVSSM